MNFSEPSTLLAAALSLDAGKNPFPWQIDLLTRFLHGRIPAAVDIPTGLGKTSVMAIWLVARACGAKVPRRLAYVVDRRAVVDQATDEAMKLRKLVDTREDLKTRLGLRTDQSLPISTLRGQHVDNKEWLENPAAPAIIVGTVDMVGSRLLFQGYGVSRKMRPYHAALLGVDCMVVLDEAHLVPPFEHLLKTIATDEDEAFRPRGEHRRQLIPEFKLLPLSATGRTRSDAGDDVLKLSERDLEDAEVRKRLNARKFLRIEPCDEKMDLADTLAQRAWALTDNGKKPARVLVYSNLPDVARKAKEAVEKLARRGTKTGRSAVTVSTELLVGGRRVFEREEAKRRLDELGFLAASKASRTQPAFLFATSAGEVGIDLDADHMVCDLVEWERMVQRLGRVNRRGDGSATVVVISDPKGGEKEEHRKRPFDHLRKNSDGSIDASPAALMDLKRRAETRPELQRIIEDASTPEPLRPPLTRALVDAWAMTSLDKHPGRPAIQPWLRGWTKEEPQTVVVWRTYAPVRTTGAPLRNKEIESFFEAAPPHTSEFLETETWRVTKWLAARAKDICEQTDNPTATAEPRLFEGDVVAFALDPDGELRKTFTLSDLKSSDDRKTFNDLLSGAVLVVDARIGGLSDGLLDDKQSAPPPTADGSDWLGEGVAGFRVRSSDPTVATSKDKNWRERFRLASKVSEDGEPTRWLIVEKWRLDAATEEDRSAAPPQLLDEHQCWTETRARHLGDALELTKTHRDSLALAARLHDEGKRAVIWQRAFKAPEDGIYAKTEGPVNNSLLNGYRHELGSLLRIENDPRIPNLSEEHRDLVLHLVAAHHGFARPTISTQNCEEHPPSVLDEKVAQIALRFARLQAQWGPWGLAWWEALLRAADQQASRDNEIRISPDRSV